MNQLTLLQEHFSKYPPMGIEDVIKLLYQQQLGTGHSAPSFSVALKAIEEEREGLAPLLHTPLWESIGNHRFRLHLNSKNSKSLSSKTLARLFMLESTEVSSIAPLIHQIELLKKDLKENLLPLTPSKSLDFIEHYEHRGYPNLHHSQVFRNHYQPHYRVVGWQGALFAPLLHSIEEQLQNPHNKSPFILAIEGRCGSGKSTLATWLHQVYPQSEVIHMDDYFIPHTMKTSSRLAAPGGNVHYERVKEEVLTPIKEGRPAFIQPFDCQKQQLKEAFPLKKSPFYIVEGSYSLQPVFGNYYDKAVFMTVPYDIQLKRLKKRNGDEMLKLFINQWIPLEEKYFEAFDIQKKASWVFDTVDCKLKCTKKK